MCIILEDFAGDVPGEFWLATFSHKNEEKNPATKIREKSSGSTTKIRKKKENVLPKTGPKTLGARLKGRTTAYASKKVSEKVLGRVLGIGSQKGSWKGVCYGFYNKKGSEKGSQRGSLKFSRRCLRSMPPQRDTVKMHDHDDPQGCQSTHPRIAPSCNSHNIDSSPGAAHRASDQV